MGYETISTVKWQVAYYSSCAPTATSYRRASAPHVRYYIEKVATVTPPRLVARSISY